VCLAAEGERVSGAYIKVKPRSTFDSQSREFTFLNFTHTHTESSSLSRILNMMIKLVRVAISVQRPKQFQLSLQVPIGLIVMCVSSCSDLLCGVAYAGYASSHGHGWGWSGGDIGGGGNSKWPPRLGWVESSWDGQVSSCGRTTSRYHYGVS